MSTDEIRLKAQKFEARTRRRNLKLLIVSVILINFLGWYSAITQHVSWPVAGGLAIAAALYVAYQLHRRGSPRAVPPDAAFAVYLEFYRAELARQRDALRGIWSWYLGPLLGAMMTLVLWAQLAHLDQPGLWMRNAPFLLLFVLWCVSLGQVSRRMARKLQRKIDALAGSP